MGALGWLTHSLADVPAGDGWLGAGERSVLADLAVARRRADWRLGRFTAKAAVRAWLGAGAQAVEIVAAPDGAPEALVDGTPAALALSLSHRAGRALALVGDPGQSLGCDLEVVEPRSAAFLADWLTAGERAFVEAAGPAERATRANLVWTAKEAAAKVRREGLRLDVRSAMVAGESTAGSRRTWRPVSVDWGPQGPRAHGWWREEPGWVMTVAGDAPVAPPQHLP